MAVMLFLQRFLLLAELFDLVLRNGDHVLHELLPERVDISYNL